MSKKKKYSDTELITADWKDIGGAFDSMVKAAQAMGLYVYSAPSFEGGDDYALIISKVPYKSNEEAEAAAMGFNKKEYKKYLNGEEV